MDEFLRLTYLLSWEEIGCILERADRLLGPYYSTKRTPEANHAITAKEDELRSAIVAIAVLKEEGVPEDEVIKMHAEAACLFAELMELMETQGSSLDKTKARRMRSAGDKN